VTDEDEASGVPRRFRTLRPNPIRDVLPWVVIAVGVTLVFRGAFEIVGDHGPGQLFVGVGLVVLGLVVFFVNRWQARRGR
jgi:hypothetical protein